MWEGTDGAIGARQENLEGGQDGDRGKQITA